MSARIGQQLLIRHPTLVDRAILCSANPGGKYADKTSPYIEKKLNNPNIPKMDKIRLVFTNNEAEKKLQKIV